MKNFTVRDMVLVALFAALTAVGAFIKVPIGPVPFTLQFLFCAYAGVLLGAKKGLYSQLLYVGIGLAGIPIFSKGGGVGYIFQPTFGFLISFIVCAFVVGLLTQNKPNQNIIVKYLAVLVGLAIVYGLGVPYFYFMWNYVNATDAISWGTAVAWAFAPYIIPDLILSFIIAATSIKILPRIKQYVK